MNLREHVFFNRNRVVGVIAIAMSAFQLYTSIFGTLEAMYQRQIHLLFACILAILIAPALRKQRKGTKWETRISVSDILWVVIGVVTLGYTIMQHDYYVGIRLGYVTPLTIGEKLLAIGIIALVLEATRRVTGPPLVIVALCFISYIWVGPFLPGILNHSGFKLDMLLDVEVFLTDGIFATPLAVSATYVFTFIAMSAFLEQAGFGDLLLALAQSIAGRAKGGPAKVAVVASGLFGMVSGSGNANVVATGTFTIPMMKRLGFSPEFAGAVEAAASTGGQIMPPVMGVAALLMVQLLGIKYTDLMIWAALPALLYYFSVFFIIDFRAGRRKLKGMEEVPQLSKVLRERGHLLIPIIILLIFLFRGYTISFSAATAVISAIMVSYLRKDTRLTLPKILAAMEKSGRDCLAPATSCAAAGLVIGVVGMTGIGNRFSSVVIDASGQSLFLALVLTAFAGIILGMGMPTAPAYVIQAALIVPALVRIGVPLVAAHLFALYFACFSMITPPVAITSYIAAGLADGNMFKTGWEAFRLAAAGYIVPFIFALDQHLLLIGETHAVIWAAITSMIGVYLLAMGLEGYWLRSLFWVERIVAIFGAICLIIPGAFTDLLGLGTLAALFLTSRIWHTQPTAHSIP